MMMIIIIIIIIIINLRLVCNWIMCITKCDVYFLIIINPISIEYVIIMNYYVHVGFCVVLCFVFFSPNEVKLYKSERQ